MPIALYSNIIFKYTWSVLFFLCLSLSSRAQTSKADSLRKLLSSEKADSSRAKFLWQLASQVNIYNPDTAIHLAQQSLYLSKKIKYEEGQSRALGVLSNSFIKIGNYPRALELNIQKLQLEEKRNIPRNLGSVLMNIGVIYNLQQEYDKALTYYKKSDSVISSHRVQDLTYYINLNMGDVYNRMNISDSAHVYFNRSLRIATEQKDEDFIGTSMTGLGHTFLKLGKQDSSLFNYRQGIRHLQAVNDDEILTEAALGLANLFKQSGQYDSSRFYASLSYSIAKKDGFLSKELEAAEFLTEHFKTQKNIDSAFYYISEVKILNDSINSRNRIRELHIITSNEQFRQFEIEEKNQQARKQRKKTLELLFTGMFIPAFIFFTLFMSRVKIHIRVIRFMGIISLMFLFEYITVLLLPIVGDITNHTVWMEILIFVVIGAILVPLHHKLEHLLIQKLVSHRSAEKESIKMAALSNQEPVPAEQPINEKIQAVQIIPGDNEPNEPLIQNDADDRKKKIAAPGMGTDNSSGEEVKNPPA